MSETSAPQTRAKGRDAAIVRGVLAVAAVRVISAGTAVLTLGIAARSLTQEEFGFVAALFSLWMILIMLDLGVGGTLTTRVAVAHARDDLDEMRMHVRDAVFTLSAIGALIAGAGTLSAFLLPWGGWVGGSLPPSTVRPAVILAFIITGATLPAIVGVVTLNGRQRMATAQLLNALRSVVALLATVVVAAMDLGPWAFILAMLGSPALVAFAITCWVVAVDLRGDRQRAALDAGRVGTMIRDSSYFALFGISNAVALGTGTFIVALILGPAAAAIFSVVSRMFTLLLSFIVLSGTQLWPAMTEAIARGELAWARIRYRHGIVVAGLATSAASLGLIVLGRPLARVWVGSELVPPLHLFVWTAAFTIVMAVAAQASVLLLAVERVRALAAVCVANAVVSVTASVLLTELIGASGAAAGAFLSCLAVLLPGIAVLCWSTLRHLEDD